VREEVVRVRKVRSDKRRDVRPLVSVQLGECIDRLSYVLSVPVKDICEAFCLEGLKSKRVIDSLSPYFTRDYGHDGTLYRGSLQSLPVHVRNKLDKKRLTVRFMQHDHERVGRLAYTMDASVSMATTALLNAAFKDREIFNRYVNSKIKMQLESERLKHLNIILKYINKNTPDEEKVTLYSIINYLASEVIDNTKTMTAKFNQWIDETIKKV
jgi:hypothetical protein